MNNVMSINLKAYMLSNGLDSKRYTYCDWFKKKDNLNYPIIIKEVESVLEIFPTKNLDPMSSTKMKKQLKSYTVSFR